MVDASLGEQPLEIKTVTGSGLVTAKWTSDNESVDQLLEDFAFTSDMLFGSCLVGERQRQCLLHTR